MAQLDERYPADLSSPARARHDIATFLTSRLLPQLVDSATLLVSELVTNSLMHGAGTIRMRATWSNGMLRVDVIDASPELPRSRATAQGGRGLRIVQHLATAWGAQAIEGEGKATWFELAAPPAQQTSPTAKPC